ncbi:MAG: D-2-hydroxyacid dehydrogenase [Firmicutes bacterium]|nr:D-2-hydroxyacid dehydrogenase [Bacillota bacterium]
MSKYIVSVVPLGEQEIERIQAMAGDYEILCFKSGAEISDEILADTEILFGNIAPARLSACKDLKYVQLESAGYDNYIVPGVLADNTMVANASGAYGIALAEHMIAGVLAVQKRLHGYRAQQKDAVWAKLGTVTGLYGSNVLIIGAGDIGTETAKRLKAFGAHVTGLKRTVKGDMEHFDKVYAYDEMPWADVLGQTDIVVIAAPLNEGTKHLINRDTIAMLKDGAIIVNGGRGPIIETEALCDALESGKLAAAVLDVTDPEPLPEDHRLWKIENAYITPHVAGGHSFHTTVEKLVELGVLNLERYLKGEAIVNRVK